jgi:hypothetical protein
MSKFAKLLSQDSKSTLSQRAQILAEEAVAEVEDFINKIKKEKRELTNQILNLTDLAPENTYSLRPGSKEFKAKEWVAELHQCRMDLALKEIELKEAQAIYDEWFGDAKTEDTK